MKMETKGQDLRGKVDNFNDVLTDVEEFIKAKVASMPREDYCDALEAILGIRDRIEDLFYCIPLGLKEGK